MALIKCPECNHEISEHAVSCPNCGYTTNTREETKKHKSKILMIILLICVVIIGTICVIFIINNKNKNKNNNNDNLTGADKAAYDMVMEICRRADDPSDIDIVSGTVTKMDDGRWGGTFKIKASGQMYNLMVHYKDGEYQPSKLQDELISYAGDILTNINFDKHKVQEAIDEYWG